MKLFRHGPKGQEKPGILDAQGRRRDLSGLVPDIDRTLLASGFAALKAVNLSSLPEVAATARLGEPVAGVGKFVCIGLNYRDHAAEANMKIPAEPIIFMKATSAIMGPGDEVLLPPTSQKSDWEVELGVVIGREARYLPLERALEHVAGVCVCNDLSERHFQIERGGQWDKGKGCDTFGPFGPYLVSLDEAGDLGALHLWLDVNEQRMQDGNTRDMIFNVPFLVHYVSQFMSLQPGDIISTGTPAGVGSGRKPPRFLQEGDEIHLGIDGLGEQRQRVRRYGAS
ncbi:MAG TPA: fumarylacetoacetate hydrolase family protein [Steroidobacteraceae bacterium]|jgi:2-keto-4-pentenoate hydratase/2-oxohepta-3-ene-1,7-dioic acid hydratase in catechol pathway|nr:fumarylacetoacetate hydrolase family protein [Steroidobacteraceae bacterium]